MPIMHDNWYQIFAPCHHMCMYSFNDESTERGMKKVFSAMLVLYKFCDVVVSRCMIFHYTTRINVVAAVYSSVVHW